jgi:hypothetical protein
VNEEALAHWGLLHQNIKKLNYIVPVITKCGSRTKEFNLKSLHYWFSGTDIFVYLLDISCSVGERNDNIPITFIFNNYMC